jgi:hypothetical protein
MRVTRSRTVSAIETPKKAGWLVTHTSVALKAHSNAKTRHTCRNNAPKSLIPAQNLNSPVTPTWRALRRDNGDGAVLRQPVRRHLFLQRCSSHLPGVKLLPEIIVALQVTGRARAVHWRRASMCRTGDWTPSSNFQFLRLTARASRKIACSSRSHCHAQRPQCRLAAL